jgi:hypothetical protein
MSRRALTTPQDDFPGAGVARTASGRASARSRKPAGHLHDRFTTPRVSPQTDYDIGMSAPTH